VARRRPVALLVARLDGPRAPCHRPARSVKAVTGTRTRAARNQRAGDGVSPVPTRPRKITPEPPTETARLRSSDPMGSPGSLVAPE